MIAGCGFAVATAPMDSIGESQGESVSFLPREVTAENFTELRTLSPFRRSIDLSDSLVLTGMATIDGQVYATLFDSSATESFVVSEQANKNGWRLVGIRGNETNLESLTAKIQVDGGQVISIRYAKIEIKNQQGSRTGGGTTGRGGSGGGSLTSESGSRFPGRRPPRISSSGNAGKVKQDYRTTTGRTRTTRHGDAKPGRRFG